MSEPTTDPAPSTDPATDPQNTDPAGTTPPAGSQDPAPSEDPPGAEDLGDKGKKALDAMKQAKKDAEAKARELEERFNALQAQVEGKEKEFQAEQERRRLEAEALGKANERILKAEVRAAATGKLADPQDALLYLDLSEFEVGSDGDVDSAAVSAAVDNLVKSKPYLAAQGQRFQGTADGGTRDGSTKPSQLSADDMRNMGPEEIDKARREGRFDDLLGAKKS